MEYSPLFQKEASLAVRELWVIEGKQRCARILNKILQKQKPFYR